MNPERLIAEAADLSSAVSRLASPGAVSGMDGSGQVEVRLAPDGSPDQIRVAEDWARRLEPARLGAAVVDAAQRAAREVTQQRPADRDPAPVSDPATGGMVRPVEELAELVIRALQDAAAASATVIAELDQPSATDARDDAGHVQVTMTGGGITGCRVDERWAAGQTGHALGAALTQAARRAAAAAPVRPDAAAGDALLADVLATQQHHYPTEDTR